MSSWSAIYGGAVDGDPVVASAQPFRDAADGARATAQNVAEVSRTFSLLDTGVADAFRGRASEALEDPMGRVIEQLDPVEGVFETIGSTLSAHGTALRRMHRQAEHALTQAAAAYRLKQAAEHRRTAAASRRAAADGEVVEADRTLWLIDAQLATVGATPEDQLRRAALQDKRDIWEGRRSTASADRERAIHDERDAAHDIRSADARLQYWHSGRHGKSWVRLRAQEEGLNARTARALAGVDLGELADPGAIEAFVSGVVDWAIKSVEQGWEGLQAIYAGLAEDDWGKVLHGLRETLAVVGDALALVALAAAVLGGPVGWIALAAAGVAGLAFLTTTALAVTKTPHYETGATLGTQDVLMSGLQFGLAAAGGAATYAMHTFSVTQLGRAASASRLNHWLFTHSNFLNTTGDVVDAVDKGMAAGTHAATRQLPDNDAEPLLTRVAPTSEILSPDEIVERQRAAVEAASPSDLRRDVTPRLCAAGQGGGE